MNEHCSFFHDARVAEHPHLFEEARAVSAAFFRNQCRYWHYDEKLNQCRNVDCTFLHDARLVQPRLDAPDCGSPKTAAPKAPRAPPAPPSSVKIPISNGFTPLAPGGDADAAPGGPFIPAPGGQPDASSPLATAAKAYEDQHDEGAKPELIAKPSAGKSAWGVDLSDTSAYEPKASPPKPPPFATPAPSCTCTPVAENPYKILPEQNAGSQLGDTAVRAPRTPSASPPPPISAHKPKSTFDTLDDKAVATLENELDKPPARTREQEDVEALQERVVNLEDQTKIYKAFCAHAHKEILALRKEMNLISQLLR